MYLSFFFISFLQFRSKAKASEAAAPPHRAAASGAASNGNSGGHPRGATPSDAASNDDRGAHHEIHAHENDLVQPAVGDPRPAAASTASEGASGPLSRIPECEVMPSTESSTRPPVRCFEYLPEDYSRLSLPDTGISEADQVARTARERFESGPLRRRTEVDAALRRLKVKLGFSEGPETTILACMAKWKEEIFAEWDWVPESGAFLLERTTLTIWEDEARILKKVRANKDRDALTDEAKDTEELVTALLSWCREFLENVDNMKQEMTDLKRELLSSSLRMMKTMEIERELDSVPRDVDQFASEILGLLEEIERHASQHGKRQQKETGLIVIR